MLGQLSHRLEIMAKRSFEVEEAVAKLVAHTWQQDLDFVEGLQSLDYLTQALEDTAILCQFLQVHLPKDYDQPFNIEEILAKLKLQETQDILVRTALECNNLVKSVSGDVDLF
jgi:hypothetical protein